MYEKRTSKVCENVKSFYTFNRNLSELSPTFYLLLFILSPFAEIFVGLIIFAFNAIDWTRTYAHEKKKVMASLLRCYVTPLTTGISGEFKTPVVNLWYTKFRPTQNRKYQNH